MIPYGRQDVSQEDIDAVVAVLRSDFLTQGPVVPRFEQAVAARCGAKHAVAANSATSALHIACLALDLGPGDRLWTVPNTFVASANCARYCGADVDFVDIDPSTWNISVSALESKLVSARSDGNLPKVVVPVHFGGQPTEQEAIWRLADEFGFKVLEDASHAVGASRNGEPVGSCKWSDITIFSFHPVKIITTAEGGLALTNDDELAWRMSMLRTHGITRAPERMQHKTDDPCYYEQLALGYNYRMTDVSAALGVSQFARLAEYLERRNFLAKRYHELLARLPLRLQTIQPGNVSAYHLFAVQLDTAKNRKDRRRVVELLRSRGIAANVHYLPVHLQPYYQRLGFRPGLCPEAERHGKEAISLPLYPRLTEANQDYVASTLADILE
jgi:UDP-4-amino-4,6-dideoxy-N-acetyl-beta-L-altrosamine transaminase